MKANRAQIERALDAADPKVRLFLLYGPDESGSRALAARLGKALAGAERVDLTGAGLKADPARLADEAASMSLFGDRRFVRVEPAGDDVVEAAAALLEAAAAGNPVVVVAGALRADARLVKLALASDAALAFASYPPEGVEADRLAMTLGREAGLQVPPDVAQRVAAASGGDRAILARELEKFALFLDAAPDRPATLGHEVLDLLAADAEEGNVDGLVDATLSGDLAALDNGLMRIDGDADAIRILRALGRRMFLLAQLRGEVARGNSVESVMGSGAARAIHFRARTAVSGQLARWTPQALARAIERVAVAERVAKSPAGGAAALGEELFALARQARRGR